MIFNTPIFCTTAFLVLLSVSAPLCAQAPNASGTPAPVDASPRHSDVEKLAVLQAQLDLMRDYDQRLLDTVYWSLGSIGGLVLLLIGLGWYTNFRIYKRDVEDIRREVKNELEDTTRRLTSDLEKLLSQLKKDLDESRVSLKKEMVDAAKKAGDSAVGSALRDVRSLQYEMLGVEAERYKKTGHLGNALLTSARRLSLAVEIYEFIHVPEVLEEMFRILKMEGISLTVMGVAEVTGLLKAVPEKYSSDVNAMIQMISSLRLEE